MTYSQAIEFLYGLRLFGAKLGLENTFKLAKLAGDPQKQLRFIHVAGTNGKGSTCAMLESIYRAGGLRVGLFTSPHLVSFRERIQVNRRDIPEVEIARLVGEMQELLELGWGTESDARSSGHPTFFEVVTIIALRYFAEQECELVIWETGLGGRLDATNIVTPLASVITNIAYDHEKWLGADLQSIAAEKAGIIKAGIPVITGTDAPEALAVIRNTARNENAPLTIVTRVDAESEPLKSVRLPIIGEHQLMNAAIAVAAVRVLQREISVSDNLIREGLSSVQWAGRLQLLHHAQQKILLDGAHNVAGAHALAVAIQKYFPGQKPVLILGVLEDKNWKGICDVLAPLASRILAVPVSSERTTDPAELETACRLANPSVECKLCASLSQALKCAASEPLLLITGSLYLVGEALELLQKPSGMVSERALNEWAMKA